MAGHNVVELTDENFDATVASGVTLVDFYADWCGPCKMMGPVIDELANEFSEKATIGKVDIDSAQSTAAKNQITSIPTLVLFKNGQEVEKIIGLQNLDSLRSLLNKHL